MTMCDDVWFGTVSSALVLAVVFCFHCQLDSSLCWFLGVDGLILHSLCNTVKSTHVRRQQHVTLCDTVVKYLDSEMLWRESELITNVKKSACHLTT